VLINRLSSEPVTVVLVTSTSSLLGMKI